MSTDRPDLRAMRAAMRAELAQRKAAARAELDRRRAEHGLPPRRRRRRRWWLALLPILLLLLLQDCSCGGKKLTRSVKGVGPAAGKATESAPEPPALRGRISRRDRPAYESTDLPPLPWLDEFRLQVAARSPRLAQCFVGVTEPGTLKWTVSVEPISGKVSDHDIEPMLQGAPITSQQKACLIAALSEPVYRLQSEQERPTPSRIGMVIEF